MTEGLSEERFQNLMASVGMMIGNMAAWLGPEHKRKMAADLRAIAVVIENVAGPESEA